MADMAQEHSTQEVARKLYAQELKKGIVITAIPREGVEGELTIDFLVGGYSPQEVVHILEDIRQSLIDNVGKINKLA